MIDAVVGPYEKREIDRQVDRVLRDLGNPEPPLSLSDVRALLKLDLRYYNSTDPNLIEELTHRFRILAGKAIPDVGKHLLSALAKSRLTAFWVPDSMRILLDQSVPKPKHRWIESHEIGHSITEWHRSFLLGDNDQTLDPLCHATIEAEANYAAGRLLFLANRFSSEARELELSFASIKKLAPRYQNSIVSTFWRMIESRDPDQLACGMVSVHPHMPNVGRHDGPDPWRYFIRSSGFRGRFQSVSPDDIFALIAKFASHRDRGPVLSTTVVLKDTVGQTWEFGLESFSTTHALLTLCSALRVRPSVFSIG